MKKREPWQDFGQHTSASEWHADMVRIHKKQRVNGAEKTCNGFKVTDGIQIASRVDVTGKERPAKAARCVDQEENDKDRIHSHISDLGPV